MTEIAVIGAGAFGTALAIALAKAGRSVQLVARSPETVQEMSRNRQNVNRLPGHRLPDALDVSLTLADSAKTIMLAVPTQKLTACLKDLGEKPNDASFVTCNKGVDLASGVGPTGIVREVWPAAPVAALSGPGFAVDIAAGLPTAMTLACADEKLGQVLQNQLSTETLRLYRTTDVTGVELGGALKNVVAIAAGIVVGLGLGESARAALMSRGFAELQRFAAGQGAQPETLAGLSGFGDLVLTCTSEKSRNFRFGQMIGSGKAPDQKMTVEGAATAQIVSNLARNAGISTPITDLVAAIVSGKLSAQDARTMLLSRPLKEE